MDLERMVGFLASPDARSCCRLTKRASRSVTGRYVEVRLIGGATSALRVADVVVHWTGSVVECDQGAGATRGQEIPGVPYLRGGTSGFGFDCSGFTYSVYRAYGITLSRDADRQALHGSPVARTGLQPGDLLFFRGSPEGSISHVGIYTSGGMMIDAPNRESVVRTELVWWSNYAAARRYLPS
jgi:gamma-D-glutamyl-L-lysine dipeptidyl-peptidase